MVSSAVNTLFNVFNNIHQEKSALLKGESVIAEEAPKEAEAEAKTEEVKGEEANVLTESIINGAQEVQEEVKEPVAVIEETTVEVKEIVNAEGEVQVETVVEE